MEMSVERRSKSKPKSNPGAENYSNRNKTSACCWIISSSIFNFLKNFHILCGLCTCAKLLQSCPTLCDPMDCSPPGKNTGVGCRALLQRIFSTQGLNPHLLGSCLGRRSLHLWATEEAPFSAVAMPIPILANGAQEFPFLHILASDLLPV